MKILDLAGIGIGPFNLSLAALLAPLDKVEYQFFDRRSTFDWHPGMMLQNTRMQTSFLKDLVTPIDPTSAYSYLSYLVKKGRLYRFINADFPRVRRVEFADYLNWVAKQVPNLGFDQDVRAIAFSEGGFDLSFSGGGIMKSKNLVVATGMAPYVAKWALPHLGSNCLHSHSYMESEFSVENRRVAIIGGGQSGVEIFLDLMSGKRGRAASIDLITRRPNLDPLDETAFINEYFTPDYIHHLYGLPDEVRKPIVKSQKLTGDGVSPMTLQELSQYLYDQDFLSANKTDYRIMPYREVTKMENEASGFSLGMKNGFDLTDGRVMADLVILATGYHYAIPQCLSPLANRIGFDEEGFPRLNEDYSVAWDGPASHRIYMQNAGRNSHGVADAQLSLAAWRSARIINSLLREDVYSTEARPSPLSWVGFPQRESGEFGPAPRVGALPNS